MASKSAMFKVYFENNEHKELRCFQLNEEQVNYLQLKITILSLFNLGSVDDFDVYWKDDDNDMITIKSNEELIVALAQMTHGFVFKIHAVTKKTLSSNNNSVQTPHIISSSSTGGAITTTFSSTGGASTTTSSSTGGATITTSSTGGASTTISSSTGGASTTISTTTVGSSSGTVVVSPSIAAVSSTTSGSTSSTVTSQVAAAKLFSSEHRPIIKPGTVTPKGQLNPTSLNDDFSSRIAKNINELKKPQNENAKRNESKHTAFGTEEQSNIYLREVLYDLYTGRDGKNHKRKRHDWRAHKESITGTDRSQNVNNVDSICNSIYTFPQEHRNVVCDGCNRMVVGYRYKCLVCHDYDLCVNCEVRGIHPQHPILRIATPDHEKSLRSICKKFRGKCKHRFSDVEDDFDCFGQWPTFSGFNDASEGTDGRTPDLNADIKKKLREAFSDIIAASVSLYSNLTNSTQKCKLSNEFTVQLYKIIDTLIAILNRFDVNETNERLQSRLDQLNVTNVLNSVLSEIELLAAQFSSLSISIATPSANHVDSSENSNTGGNSNNAGTSGGNVGSTSSGSGRDTDASRLVETLNGLISQLGNINLNLTSVERDLTDDQPTNRGRHQQQQSFSASRSTELPEINIPQEITNICTTIAGVAHTAAAQVFHNIFLNHGRQNLTGAPYNNNNNNANNNNNDNGAGNRDETNFNTESDNNGAGNRDETNFNTESDNNGAEDRETNFVESTTNVERASDDSLQQTSNDITEQENNDESNGGVIQDDMRNSDNVSGNEIEMTDADNASHRDSNGSIENVAADFKESEKPDQSNSQREDDELVLLTKLYDMGFTDADANLEEVLRSSQYDLNRAVSALLMIKGSTH